MQIYNYGYFGQAVYDELVNQSGEKTTVPSLIQIELNQRMETWFNPNEKLHVLISDYPLVNKAKEMENRVFDTGGVLIPIMIDYPYLTIGPVVQNGTEGCFHCFIDRSRQHDRNAHLQKELTEYYENNQSVHHRSSFYPTDSILVAHFLINLLKGKIENNLGKVRRLNVYNRTSYYVDVIGVHGCKRCGMKVDEKERSFAELWKAFGKKELINQ